MYSALCPSCLPRAQQGLAHQTECGIYRCSRVSACLPSKNNPLPMLKSEPLPLPLKQRGRGEELIALTREEAVNLPEVACPAGGSNPAQPCSTCQGDPRPWKTAFCSLFIWKIGNSAYLPTASGYHMDRRRKSKKSLLRSQINRMVTSDSISQICWVCAVVSCPYPD